MAVRRSLHHDLQQPLVTMIGFAQVLLRDWGSLEDAERGHLLETIEREGMRLSTMLSEIPVLREMAGFEEGNR